MTEGVVLKCKENDMKRIFATFGLLIMISSVVLAGGTENPSTTSNTAIVRTTDGVRVFYKSEKVAKVKVTIYNQSGERVFFEEVKSRLGFSRPYNLTNMPQGDYRVVLEDENGTSEKIISNVKESAKVMAAVINARKEYNRCLVTLYSNRESEVTVRLLDTNANELAVENYTVSGQSSKLFNLANFKGAVSVEVSDANGIIKTTTLE
jgi:hypothetical protein